jgi:hypothetical protein
MAEDALRRREDYLRLTIDTIPEAVGDAELVEYSHAGDSSAMVLATSMLRPKFGFQIGGDAHSENFEDAINRAVRLPMAATDRDHAIQPVVVRVRGLE